MHRGKSVKFLFALCACSLARCTTSGSGAFFRALRPKVKHNLPRVACGSCSSRWPFGSGSLVRLALPLRAILPIWVVNWLSTVASPPRRSLRVPCPHDFVGKGGTATGHLDRDRSSDDGDVVVFELVVFGLVVFGLVVFGFIVCGLLVQKWSLRLVQLFSLRLR